MASRSVKLKSGRLLDQKLIEKLSSEAERGYDLTKANRVFLREGRPANGEEGGESPRVASRIPESVFRAAKKRAVSEGLTVSEVIRALLVGYAAGHSSRVSRSLGVKPAARSSDRVMAPAANKGESTRSTKPAKRSMASRRNPTTVRSHNKPAR
jgi:predicted DNA binding CopG/RHH family protein